MDRVMSVLDNLQFIEEVRPQELTVEKTAFQMLLEREVTVRYLDLAAANDPRLYSQFIKDGRTLASLRHRNIVHVYEAGINSDNLPYLILEKPDGITAKQRIDQVETHRTRIGIDQVLNVMSGVSEGLEYLHQQNVILHSLSPDYIILTNDMATILTSLGHPIVGSTFNAPVDTLAYAPPERLFNGRGDVRSDVYSLGVLLHHLLFGNLPFKGNVYEIVAQKQNGVNVPAFQAFDNHFSGSDALRQVLRRALATRPEDRYASAGSFRTALTDILSPQSADLRLPSILVKNIQNGSQNIAVQTIWSDHQYQNGSNGNGAAKKMSPSSNGQLKETPVPSPQSDQNRLKQSLNGSHQNGHNAQPFETNGKAKQAESVNAVGIAEEDNERDSLDQAEISPLMPGLDNVALKAAIPYTTLVPMPDQTTQKPETGLASAGSSASSHTWSKYKRTLGMAALGAVGIIAAINLG